MYPAGLVAAVGVVVAGKEVAVLVERQLLRVPQAGGEELQLRAVRVATEDGSRVGVGDFAAVDAGDVQAAVAGREVQLAVRAHAQAVQVVADEADVHAIAV